jgi:hypothetical protein
MLSTFSTPCPLGLPGPLVEDFVETISFVVQRMSKKKAKKNRYDGTIIQIVMHMQIIHAIEPRGLNLGKTYF